MATEKNLPMVRLVSVCTDGAPCMIGKKSGLVALIRDHLKRPILSYHCILHQEALCAQILDKELGDVMDVVTSVVKFIVARSLNHRQFKALLDECENSYPGLLLHSNIRWLSKGSVLKRFADCLSEVRKFLETKKYDCPELSNSNWLHKFFLSCQLDGAFEPSKHQDARCWKHYFISPASSIWV